MNSFVVIAIIIIVVVIIIIRFKYIGVQLCEQRKIDDLNRL